MSDSLCAMSRARSPAARPRSCCPNHQKQRLAYERTRTRRGWSSRATAKCSASPTGSSMRGRIAERVEGVEEAQSQIDFLLERLRALGKMASASGLARGRPAPRGTRTGPRPWLRPRDRRRAPSSHSCTPEGVAGKPLDLLGEAPGPRLLDRLERCARGARGAGPGASCVSDLQGQRVLERVLEIREERRLVQKLGGLQAREPAAEELLAGLRSRLEERERGHPFR